MEQESKIKTLDPTKKYAWFLVESGSDMDGIRLYTYKGTVEETRRRLLSMVYDSRVEDDSFDMGAETLDDIEYQSDRLYCYACYYDYHRDYTALLQSDVLVDNDIPEPWVKITGDDYLKCFKQFMRE